MGTPYLACLQRQFPPWKIKALLWVKSTGPYLAGLEPISAVLLQSSKKQPRPRAGPLLFSRHEV
jgi:hypothetical protein